MSSVSVTKPEDLYRRLRNVRIAGVSLTFSLLVLAGGVSVYVVYKKNFLTQKDQKEIASVVAPAVREEVATSLLQSVGEPLQKRTLNDEQEIRDIRKQLNAAAGSPAVARAVASNARRLQELSRESNEKQPARGGLTTEPGPNRGNQGHARRAR